MNTKSTAVLTAFLFALIVVLGGAAVLKGGLFIGKHEGDMLHLMQIVFRMADGQLPHLDFMTPIGVLAFWPIAKLVQAGFGIGMAVIWAQVLMALVFLPMVVWIAKARLRPTLAAAFGLIVMVLLLALVHGEAQRSVSISMHYNRLAWAAAFVAILAAVVPPYLPERSNKAVLLDGVIIGIMVSFMALIKMTYFISFAVPIVVGLTLTGQRRALLVSLCTGLAGIAVITVFTGIDFWFAYADDLLLVALSEVRPAPGEPLSAIMAAPAYLGGTVCLIAAVIFLRQAKVDTGGLVLLLLMPGFFYVTYQNYGNDPQWLLLLAVLLIAFQEQAADIITRWGWSMRHGLGVLAAVAFALIAPSFLNLAYSPLRHMVADEEKFTPMLPRSEIHDDFQSYASRVNRIDARVALDGQIAGLELYEDRDPPLSFMGVDIEICAVELGLPRVMDAIARDLEDAGLSNGKSVFAADIFSSYWLFGDLEPADQGAPWYYGGLPGLADADYFLVPICPVLQAAQRKILGHVEEALDAGELGLTEVRRTELYLLYAVN